MALEFGHPMKVRIIMGRRRPLQLLPYTGPVFCGCRMVNGDVVTPCEPHALAAGEAPAADRPRIAR